MIHRIKLLRENMIILDTLPLVMLPDVLGHRSHCTCANLAEFCIFLNDTHTHARTHVSHQKKLSHSSFEILMIENGMLYGVLGIQQRINSSHM